MIAVQLSGTISKQPETRTTSKGSEFCFTSVRVQSQDGDTFASITAFEPSLVTLLKGLQKGDSVTVCGTGKVSMYQPANGGEPRASLSITVNRLVALVDAKAPPRQRQNRTESGFYQQNRNRPPEPEQQQLEPMNDAIPF